MASDVERILCQLPSVFVFKIPPRRSAEGHRASDWPKDSTWNGKLKIVVKGRQAAIILQDDANQVFAVCPVSEGAVEKTLDSGRYYVLRIQNAQGKHAYIGLAFNERNDAFDFNVALQEHQKDLEREDKAAEVDVESLSIQHKDMSLKEGEKIRINIGGVAAQKRSDKKPSSGGGGGGFLAPPTERAPGSQRAAPAPTQHAFDVFGSGSSGSSGGFSSSGPASDPFAGSFGSSDPFAAPAAPVPAAFPSSDPFAPSSGAADPFSSGDPFAAPRTAAPASSSVFGFGAQPAPAGGFAGGFSAPPQSKPKQAGGGDLLDFNF